MARDAITITTIPLNAELEPPAAVTGVAANDLIFTAENADDQILLRVDNTGGSDHTVTLVTGGTVSGIGIEDVAVVVTAGETRLFRYYDLTNVWFQSGTSDVWINIADNTDLKFWAFKL